jgi:FlaA1/EpsC-like NDP-sugar epimerase
MDSVPRSLMPIQFLLLVFGLGGGRFCYRFWKDYVAERSQDQTKVDKVIIIGAGRAGERLCKEIMVNPNLNLKVEGFLDDDKNKWNRSIHNVKILGAVNAAKDWIEKYEVKKVFIAIPSCSSATLKEIKSSLDLNKVELKILPRMDHLLNPRGELSLLRNISIEDLLGREQVHLNESGINELLGRKVIMVTGAGGSIGSELCLQIARFNPELMVLVDNSEYNLYELEQQFKHKFPNQKILLKIADIREFHKIEQIFSGPKVNVLYHAAAYKHVPMMEMNPEAAVLTNIYGTRNLAELAIKFKVEKFVMVSTDKAVNPTNIMGTSKRIAEMICNYYQNSLSVTKFMSVRFGNVLGSSGSVIPLFKKQIEERRNMTVTHPDVIRYFMSIPEASQLILQASLIGNGGEVFVLEMGEAVKIVDLAKEMIKLAGLTEGVDISIEFTGLRPGEKLFAETTHKIL